MIKSNIHILKELTTMQINNIPSNANFKGYITLNHDENKSKIYINTKHIAAIKPFNEKDWFGNNAKIVTMSGKEWTVNCNVEKLLDAIKTSDNTGENIDLTV